MKSTSLVQKYRKRSTINCALPIKTDQSDKNACDINLIMENYQKTGLLPHFEEKIPSYVDNTTVPSLLDAHASIRAAKNLFMELPSQIRKLMDNNPENLETFLQDRENLDILVKHGVIEKKQIKSVETKVSKDSPKAKPAEAKEKPSKDTVIK